MNPQESARTESSLMDPYSAARWLNLSPGHLMNMRSTGIGPDFVRLGRSVRYRLSDLEAWVENGRVER